MLTIELKEIMVPLIWLGIAVLMFIVEACTVSLVSVWFGIAALVSCILAAFGVKLYIQIIVFCVLSVCLFVLFFVLLKKKKHTTYLKSETPDEFVDEIVVVTKDIKPGEIGEVKARYDRFNALSVNPKDEILAGAKVKVVDVSGNKLVVKKID